MLVGYARVSTADQSLDLQHDALAAAGCERIFDDTASGVRADRAGLADALAFVRPGDVLAVWRLDRLGRSLKDLIGHVDGLRERGVGFQSLTEGIDTTTAGGQLAFHVFGSLAQFEREMIRERTIAGLESARARGRKGGRPAALTREQVDMVSRLIRIDPEMTIAQVCQAAGGISRSTLYRYVAPDGTVRRMPT